MIAYVVACLASVFVTLVLLTKVTHADGDVAKTWRNPYDSDKTLIRID